MSVRPWTPWTAVEVANLREHYAELGVKGCMQYLPGRTEGCIRSYAGLLKLRRKHGRHTPRISREKAMTEVRRLMAVHNITAAELVSPTGEAHA